MPRPEITAACFTSLLIATCTSHDENQQPAHLEPELPPSLISPSLPTEPPVPEAWTDLDPITPLKHKPLTGAAGDVTGDAQLDVVVIAHVPGNTTGLVVLSGTRDGHFTEGPPVPVEATGIALGDFDTDGDLDALILDAGRRPSFRVAQNLGAGSFELTPSRAIPGRYGGELRHAALADLDTDGDLDAVVPLWDSLRVLHGDGHLEFTDGQRLLSARDPFSCALADLDADGDLDLVTGTGAGFPRDDDNYDSAGASLWLYRGGPRGFAKPEGIFVAAVRQVVIADLDADGDLEVAATGSAGVTIVHDPLGARATQLFSVASDGPLLAADLTGTPALDLVTSSYIQGRVHVVTGYPTPSKTSLEAGDYVSALFAADVARNQGRPDLVLLNAGPPPQPFADVSPSIAVVFTDD
jgi:hypothetical protein